MNENAPSAGQFLGRIHILPVRIYYEDTDFTGLVYHANYLRYFERGRSDFMRAAGVAHSDLLALPEPLGLTINKMEIDFLRPARIDDALTVRTAYDAIRGPRFFITQEIRRGEEEIARAQVQACCISMTGKPRRPPAMLSEKLTQYFQP
ncbi:MAG: YbgC/FadM family acyl-CoA thioesterase [Hyphomonadaceae bacterium]